MCSECARAYDTRWNVDIFRQTETSASKPFNNAGICLNEVLTTLNWHGLNCFSSTKSLRIANISLWLNWVLWINMFMKYTRPHTAQNFNVQRSLATVCNDSRIPWRESTSEPHTEFKLKWRNERRRRTEWNWCFWLNKLVCRWIKLSRSPVHRQQQRTFGIRILWWSDRINHDIPHHSCTSSLYSLLHGRPRMIARDFNASIFYSQLHIFTISSIYFISVSILL